MGGIAGVLFADGQPVTAALVERMVGGMPRRGADGITAWSDGVAGFARMAHATTPEAVGEVQPFVAPGSGAVMLFDGHIDNREELLDRLGVTRGPLATAPDGAIVLALFEAEGRECIRRLAGDYAFALWEPRHRRIELFRSPIGWRPLLWTFDGRRFAFASEPRALIVGLGVEKRLNEGAFGEYLAGRFVTETDTLWGGIERVPQGASIRYHDGRVTCWAWHGGPYEDWTGRSMADHVDRFNQLFDQALAATMRCNGAVTSQLSGGLDSSSVVCRATEMFRDGRVAQQIGALSARFPGEPHDESEWSSAVEAHCGITAEVVGPHRFDADEARAWTASTLQLPIRPNVLDTLAGACTVMQADGRRVLLTGEGGDDWLNGTFAHWPDWLRGGKWRALFGHGRAMWPTSPWWTVARRTLKPALLPLVSARHRQSTLNPFIDHRLDRPDWLDGGWIDRIALSDRWRQGIARDGLKGFDQPSRYNAFSLGRRHVIAETVLAYTAAHGVELRHPFHDRRLTDFCMGLDARHLRAFDTRKLLLREAMTGTLPEKVRQRRTKAMFVGHQIDAIDALLRERPVDRLHCVRLGWVKADRIAAMHAPFAAWRAAGSAGPTPETAWGQVWFTLATDIWLEHAFGLSS